MPHCRLALNVQVVQEIGHPATLYPMVEAGIGISILPALALPLPSGRTVRRLYPEINRSLMLIKRKTGHSPRQRRLSGRKCVSEATLLTQDRA